MRYLVKEIGDFIFVEDEPQRFDFIITDGGSFHQNEEKSSERYKNGFEI